MTVLNQTTKGWLVETCGRNVVFDEPMSRHTSFRVGGPAEAFVTPQNRDDLIRLVQWACVNGIPCMPLGNGSNILVMDKGISGIVVSLKKCLVSIHHGVSASDRPLVAAEAGVRLSALCTYVAKRGFTGLNLAIGIPGTVGGGVRVNAGTAAGSLGDLVQSIGILMPDGTTRSVERRDLKFAYRTLNWPEGMNGSDETGPIILESVFQLERADKHGIEVEADKLLKERKQHQPWRAPNAGCIFKNPAGQAAGKLIDMAGLKGCRIGDAEVSTTHANFIINRGAATARDILDLMDIVRRTVFERYDIQLETEVRIVGD